MMKRATEGAQHHIPANSCVVELACQHACPGNQHLGPAAPHVRFNGHVQYPHETGHIQRLAATSDKFPIVTPDVAAEMCRYRPGNEFPRNDKDGNSKRAFAIATPAPHISPCEEPTSDAAKGGS